MRARNSARAALALLLALALLAVACSADPACVLGTRGWCENEMAALALRTAAERVPAVAQAETVIVVEDGFAVQPSRYGSANVRPLKADQAQGDGTTRAISPVGVTVIIANVQVVNAPGPGNQAAQGRATVMIYQGGRQIWQETVKGKLLGSAWVLDK